MKALHTIPVLIDSDSCLASREAGLKHEGQSVGQQPFTPGGCYFEQRRTTLSRCQFGGLCPHCPNGEQGALPCLPQAQQALTPRVSAPHACPPSPQQQCSKVQLLLVVFFNNLLYASHFMQWKVHSMGNGLKPSIKKSQQQQQRGIKREEGVSRDRLKLVLNYIWKLQSRSSYCAGIHTCPENLYFLPAIT